ncbi:hypothetical protein AVEN_142913-1 [Araneus ventricosus]|uniref:Uncharacterized protein n=1 Tax=Araneus ventricosus TaxID=182803 RepID=A0A4Y2FNN5_ARAVE|nr:hypothetical protein AVEN_142913-1 [Araneus ventricosus]
MWYAYSWGTQKDQLGYATKVSILQPITSAYKDPQTVGYKPINQASPPIKTDNVFNWHFVTTKDIRPYSPSMVGIQRLNDGFYAIAER